MPQTEAQKAAQARWREKNKDKRKEYNRRQYLKGKDLNRASAAKRSKLKGRYGLTTEEYDRLIQQPCEICGKEGPNVIDHSLAGSYHGVLCHGCNIAIGQFNHDTERIERAAQYVGRTRGRRDDDGGCPSDVVGDRGEPGS